MSKCVWLVYEGNADGVSLGYSTVHLSERAAFAAWNRMRLNLIRDYRQQFRRSKGRMREMYAEMIQRLKCKDPQAIDNYPHSTPHIRVFEVSHG